MLLPVSLMNAVLVKIFATALALSQVMTRPDTVKTQFNPAQDQAEVVSLLQAGCAHMRKLFAIEEHKRDWSRMPHCCRKARLLSEAPRLLRRACVFARKPDPADNVRVQSSGPFPAFSDFAAPIRHRGEQCTMHPPSPH